MHWCKVQVLCTGVFIQIIKIRASLVVTSWTSRASFWSASQDNSSSSAVCIIAAYKSLSRLQEMLLDKPINKWSKNFSLQILRCRCSRNKMRQELILVNPLHFLFNIYIAQTNLCRRELVILGNLSSQNIIFGHQTRGFLSSSNGDNFISGNCHGTTLFQIVYEVKTWSPSFIRQTVKSFSRGPCIPLPSSK